MSALLNAGVKQETFHINVTRDPASETERPRFVCAESRKRGLVMGVTQ